MTNSLGATQGTMRAAARIIAQLEHRAEVGQLELCEHLGAVPATERPLWYATRPERLMCQDCCNEAVDDVVGTPEVHRCDDCGRWGQKHLDRYDDLTISPTHPALKDYRMLTIAFSICPRCRTTA